MAQNISYDGTITCVLPVSSLEKSLNWYQQILGFELIYQLPETGWAEVTSPTKNVSVGLSQAEAANVGGSGSAVVFGVVDIDEARRQLEAKKVRFDGETVTIPEMVRLATFVDRDGNKLMLAQTLTKQ
jgi:predicted enzyme related to lactoylglutathione lyase